MYLPDEVLEEIVAYTNLWIEKTRPSYNRPRDAANTNIVELKPVIGPIYLAAVVKSRNLNLKDVWATVGTGVEAFRLSMSRTRFPFILRALRFDNITIAVLG